MLEADTTQEEQKYQNNKSLYMRLNLIDMILSHYVKDGNPEIWYNEILTIKENLKIYIVC